MANVLGELFQNIANAIRSKTGSTDTLKPNEFPAAIEGITTGGGGSSGDNRVKYVTFMYGETELIKYPVISGDTCRDPVANGYISAPTKESTAQYDYTFYGWGASDGGAADANILKNITEDKTVYAIFTATARLYTITWLDEDGTELPGQKQWAYGTVPSYTPTKDGYAFDKWTPTPVAVTGDASYVASWSSVVAAGTFSTGLAWKLMADGTLTISGSGSTPTYGKFATTGTEAYTSSPIYPYYSQIKYAVFESGVTVIGSYLLYKCTALESVTFADTVATIGSNAFGECTNLGGTLRIPASTLGDNCFYMCSKVTEIQFGYARNLNPKGYYAYFMSMTGVTSLVIGAKQTLSDLGTPTSGTLYYLNGFPLESITVDEANPYLSVVDGVLYDKAVSTLVLYPKTKVGVFNVLDTVISIPVDAINANESITGFTVGENNTAYSSPDGISLFNKGVTELIFLPRTVSSYTIPSTVITIAFNSCRGNENITSITIPNSVTTIDRQAFANCSKLVSVTIGTGVTNIGTYAFSSTALTSATFKNTSGWYVTKTEGASSGTNVTVTNTSSAATYLKTTYVGYYWYRK